MVLHRLMISPLAMGAGGLEVAQAMAGRPYQLCMPEAWAVELTGESPPWVSANMVTELGATSTVFPAYEAVRPFLRSQGLKEDFEPWAADPFHLLFETPSALAGGRKPCTLPVSRA